ncbi:MAG: hypothetical protein R3C49_15015 [Planctomycetaceae bacterium]
MAKKSLMRPGEYSMVSAQAFETIDTTTWMHPPPIDLQPCRSSPEMPRSKRYFVRPAPGFENNAETVRDSEFLTEILHRRLHQWPEMPALEVFRTIRESLREICTINWDALQLSVSLSEDGRSAETP